MNRLILQMQTSIDSYVDSTVPGSRWQLWNWGPDWSWTPDLRTFFNEVLDGAAGILLSRPMIDDGYVHHWQAVAQQHPRQPDYRFARRIGQLPKFVASTAGRPTGNWPGDVAVLNGPLPDIVTRAKEEARGDLICFGGAGLATSLLHHDLVDELQLFINPGFAGSGTQIFDSSLTTPLRHRRRRRLPVRNRRHPLDRDPPDALNHHPPAATAERNPPTRGEPVSTTIINYRVRPDAAAENERLIEELLAAIARVTARCRLSLNRPM